MTSHSNAEQEEPTTAPAAADTESGVEEDAESDVNEETKRWLSTAYEYSSKKPMKEPFTEPWGLPISDADLEKLRVGFKSRDMDDKWDFLMEDPDGNGNLSLHIIRSWLQEDCYIFHIVPRSSSDDGGDIKIQSFTWEGNKGGLQCDAEQAQKEAVILCRGHLRCKFEMLPQYGPSVFWDPKAYKRVGPK